MKEFREKTIGYRRALWLAGTRSLESYIREAWRILPDIRDRTYVRNDDQEVKILTVGENTPGLLLHISADTPGEWASIVPDAGDKQSIDVSTTNPPTSTEFMDGDAFAYIHDDHVCLCVSLVHDAIIYGALRYMFSSARLSSDAQKFELIKVADTDKLKMIHGEGIDYIDLRASVYQASMDYLRRSAQAQGLLGKTAKNIKALVGTPNDVTKDSLQINLIIKKDKRVRKHLTLGEKELDFVATSLLENQEAGDYFSIHLDSGQIITQDEIYIRKKLPVLAKGKSVDRDKAWASLIAFYKQLKSQGVLGQ
jgi:hypothetical protein